MSETVRPEAARESRWGSLLYSLGVPLAAVALALFFGLVIIFASGKDPAVALSALLTGAFGGPAQIGETLLRATPLVFTGLAVAYGFRAGLFNIGAEGQLFMGGLAAAWLGVLLHGPWYVNIPILLIAAMLFGAAWAFVPALLKAKVGAHEVITTMMFSWIALFFVSFLVTYPLRGPSAIPQTAQISAGSVLPRFSAVFTTITPTRAHFGVFVALAAALVVWFLLKYTTTGYEARAVGFNPAAAENAGISVAATTVKSLCISGALAGLAGAVQVMGLFGKLFEQFSSGFGFTGIAVALVAKNNPLGVIPAALLFGALNAGAGTMQLEAGVSQKLIDLIQGLVILFVACENILTWYIRKRQKSALARREVGSDAR